jgi:hypothetical protein
VSLSVGQVDRLTNADPADGGNVPPSSPSSMMRLEARSRSASTKKTGALIRPTPRRKLLEGVAETGEQVLALRGDGAVRVLLAAQLSQLAHQLLLPGVEPGGRADLEVNQ